MQEIRHREHFEQYGVMRVAPSFSLQQAARWQLSLTCLDDGAPEHELLDSWRYLSTISFHLLML